MLANDDGGTPRSAQERPLLRVVFAGHVDHGKSTLIGRLLHETGSLPDGKVETLTAVSQRRGLAFEWAFVLDALQTERDQGITLDTSQTRLRTAARDIVLIDAPGHAELLRNMVTGAAQADAAVLVVDGAEGLRDQTRRHIHFLHLLGVPQIAVAINKMDRIAFDKARFAALEAEIKVELARLGLAAVAILPIAARHGDGVARRTPALAWYDGPTVVQVLDGFAPATPLAALPLRLPVQAVYRVGDRRIVAGRIESGGLTLGDDVVIAPGGTRARIASIETWPAPADGRAPEAAEAGRSIGVTLDQPVVVDRGDLLGAAGDPAEAVLRLRARVFWLHDEPLRAGATVGVRIGTAERRGTIASVENVFDPGALTAEPAQELGPNHIGEVEIALDRPAAADTYAKNPRTGRLVLDVAGRIAGGGIILARDDGGGRRTRAASRDRDAQAVSRLGEILAPLPPQARLAHFCREVEGRIVFTTSFGLEDQAILHMLHELAAQDSALAIDVVTLDTGRLFPETYAVWAESERRYGRLIRAVCPLGTNLETLVGSIGINGFYASADARQACCHVRKVEPLARALAGAAGWIVGLRADQSGPRKDTALVSRDARGLIKFSPLFDWSRAAVEDFNRNNGVPVNALHARGFASIGCAPCTRAIAPGEPERAGRWWWEQDGKRECGLHDRSAGTGAGAAQAAPADLGN